MNQPDKALQQFDQSLTIEPKHAKTLLNIGIVLAFGKQDLKGATVAWQRVLAAAPGTDEARAAQQGMGIRHTPQPPQRCLTVLRCASDIPPVVFQMVLRIRREVSRSRSAVLKRPDDLLNEQQPGRDL